MKKREFLSKVGNMIANDELGDLYTGFPDFNAIDANKSIKKQLKKLKKEAVGDTLSACNAEVWRQYKPFRLLYERVKFDSLTKDEWNELNEYRSRYSFRDVTGIVSGEEYRKERGIDNDRVFFETVLHSDDILFGNNKVALTTGRLLPRI